MYSKDKRLSVVITLNIIFKYTSPKKNKTKLWKQASFSLQSKNGAGIVTGRTAWEKENNMEWA